MLLCVGLGHELCSTPEPVCVQAHGNALGGGGRHGSGENSAEPFRKAILGELQPHKDGYVESNGIYSAYIQATVDAYVSF